MRRYPAAGVAAWTQRQHWLPSEAQAEAPAHGAHAPPDVQSVKLSEEAVRGLGLKAAPVAVRDYPKVVEVPGVVIDPPGVSDRAVSAPVGRVQPPRAPRLRGLPRAGTGADRPLGT